MNRSILVSFLAAVTLFNSAAFADVIYDLPNLEEGATPPQPPPPPVRPSREEPPTTTPVEKPEEKLVGRVIVKQVSRKTGGTVYHIDLRKPLPLTNIDIKVLGGNVKIREGSVLTIKGERIAIREFKNVQVVPTGSKLFSEILNLTTPLAAIEISAESYVETADIQIEATSDVATPTLRLKVEAPKPTTPPPPPRPQEPGAQAPSRVTPIRVGDRVLYTSGGSVIFAEVLEMFQTGDIRVHFDGYSSSSLVSISTLSKGINCAAAEGTTICKDDRVMYQSGGSIMRGFIKEVFSNGKVRLLFDGYSTTSMVPLATVSKLTGSSGGYSKGDRVLYVSSNSTMPATVGETFRNGVIYIRQNGYSSDSYTTSSSLTSAAVSVGDLVNGSTVLYTSGNSITTATVQQLYRNGLAAVRLNGYSSDSIIKTSSLSKATNCRNAICVNNKVLYSTGSSRIAAVVVQTFASDIVQVKLEGYSSPSFVRVGTLFKELNCVNTGSGSICRGNRVIYLSGSSKKTATVVAVFGAENVSVRFDGYSSNSFVPASTLFK
jgi:hypothetical protein